MAAAGVLQQGALQRSEGQWRAVVSTDDKLLRSKLKGYIQHGDQQTSAVCR